MPIIKIIHKKEKNNTMKQFILFFIFLSLISCLMAFTGISWLFIYAHTPAGQYQEKRIHIQPGDNFQQLTYQLNHAKLIKKPMSFRLLGRITGVDTRIQAGEYVLNAAMTPFSVIDMLIQGKVALYKVVIPEGYSIIQIADTLHQLGIVSKTVFIDAATNPSFVRKFGLDATTFEGYLFPDTYYFPKAVSSEKVITTMVNRFSNILTEKWILRTKELNFSIHEIITLASIIEKETGKAEERQLISSVFHNRLKKNMRLESDPTVIYGISDFDGNITKVHLKTKTEYNTYTIKGLPPGPIANPGAKAIEAALYPSDTNYLYFVAKNDGTHQFSEKFKDHNSAVQKYQK